MFKIVIFVIIFMFLASNTAFAGIQEGGGGSGGDSGGSSTPAVSSSGGGGGSRQTSIENLLKTLQDAKNKKNPKFDELAKLLYVPPFITKGYDKNLSLGLAVNGNGTLTRNEKFVISATVENPNPIEVRRVLYLDLYMVGPGDGSFRKMNSVPIMITNNEYDIVRGRNLSTRTFPELTTFNNLKTTGHVVLKLNVGDGQYIWSSENLTLNIINRPPILENLTLQAPEKPKFNDPIIYTANVTDLDEDLVNVTLHILDDQNRERKNETRFILPGDIAKFVASENGFFDKADSGKNFTYYYSFSDGIVVNNTTVQMGPSLRKSASIWVGKAVVSPEDKNQYWWQRYNFSVEMKNQDPEAIAVRISLLTNTKSHPWKTITEAKTVTLTQEPQVIYFNVQPFDVMDANQAFSFGFKYSETDQHNLDHIEVVWKEPINAKLLRYEFVSGLGLGNILALLLISLLVSIIVERRFYR